MVHSYRLGCASVLFGGFPARLHNAMWQAVRKGSERSMNGARRLRRSVGDDGDDSGSKDAWPRMFSTMDMEPNLHAVRIVKDV